MLVAALGLSPIPPNVHLSLTDRALTLDSAGAIISTAVICSGFTFDSFGSGGPHLSPDQHWVLVDILGPYAPGNVPRNHALVNVRTGSVIHSSDFPAVLGIPSAPDGVAWASGERSSLRYATGKLAVLLDPPSRPLPPENCPRVKT